MYYIHRCLVFFTKKVFFFLDNFTILELLLYSSYVHQSGLCSICHVFYNNKLNEKDSRLIILMIRINSINVYIYYLFIFMN